MGSIPVISTIEPLGSPCYALRLLSPSGQPMSELPSTLTPQALEAYVKNHFNEVVVSCLDLGRLVGVASDDSDYYYILKFPYGSRHSISYTSAVGDVMLLKGQLKDDDYDRLERLLALNGCEPEEEVKLDWRDAGVADS